MPTLNDVYRKFGETSEAAQLLETELGTILLEVRARNTGLFVAPNPGKAREILDQINSSTLGQLLRQVSGVDEDLDQAVDLLMRALAERNRLSHSFFRQHNLRCNSEAGCTLMLEDLESIHDTLLLAYKLVMRVSGVDLDTMIVKGDLPTQHLDLD